ncbi:MAG TPA: fibronectin type III domain-containing protein [Polyangia bacterium]|nr:fibronectin type III domain-containing protein [Polyangia bacterium]
MDRSGRAQQLTLYGAVFAPLLVACVDTSTTPPDASARDAGPEASVPDTTPPSFGGLTMARADTAYSLRLFWDAASDNLTSPNFIEYRAFVADVSGSQDFGRAQSSIVGSTAGLVGALSPGRPYFVVVRAVDRAGNMDSNRVEKMVTTPTPAPPTRQFGAQIEPLLQASCTTLDCHNAVSLSQGMNLDSAATAYTALVGVNSTQHPELERVKPTDSGQSYLVRKLLGYLGVSDGERMPNPASGLPPLADSDINLIREWIDQGAPNN